ncbi:MAG TPA: ribonuclease HI family protein [Capsulimonadaceae bacterium]|nr:ribonuclease HI family protein [Capsulimonadaceae bacterium]
MRLAIDGASKGNPGPAGAGVVIMDGDGQILEEIAKPLGIATNNVAEYQALILGLEEAKKRGACHITVQTDSQLLARQVEGRYKISAPHLRELHSQVRALIELFKSVEITHTLREGNTQADALANQGARANRL